MKTLIDHTGLHSGLNPILKETCKEIDLQGMLQLCLLIIFSDEILVDNRKEKTEVTNFTELAIDNLVNLGLEKEVFRFTNFSEVDYDELYKLGAKELADDVNFMFAPNMKDLSGLYPEGLNNNFLKTQTEFARLASNASDAQITEIIDEWKSEKTVTLTDYLIAISPDLKSAIKYYVEQNPSLTNEELYQLNIFLRFRINELFASRKNATHTPSIARAKLIRKGENFLIQKVQSKLDNIIREIKGVGALMPSIIEYLILRSKGNIFKLLEITLELRVKAKPLREKLDDILKTSDLSSVEGKFDLDQKLDEFIKLVKFDLGVDTPKMTDVFEFTLSSWLLFDIKQGKLLDWIKYKRNKNKISVLTEVSKFALYGNSDLNKVELKKMFRK